MQRSSTSIARALGDVVGRMHRQACQYRSRGRIPATGCIRRCERPLVSSTSAPGNVTRHRSGERAAAPPLEHVATKKHMPRATAERAPPSPLRETRIQMRKMLGEARPRTPPSHHNNAPNTIKRSRGTPATKRGAHSHLQNVRLRCGVPGLRVGEARVLGVDDPRRQAHVIALAVGSSSARDVGAATGSGPSPRCLRRAPRGMRGGAPERVEGCGKGPLERRLSQGQS